MNDVIVTEHLTKHYKDFHAVRDVSLQVGKGEIYGFLGLNGAGKTTTIRMLLGMIRPSAGKAFLNGQRVDAANPQLWNSVGYMVETPYAYPELTTEENLRIFQKLRGLTNSRSLDQVINELQLSTYRHTKAKHLSLGNAQRLGIAKALLHHPSILILDEPSNGLDPAGIAEIRGLLRDLAYNRKVTIFISSHILDEISKIATRVGIIHQGQLIQELGVQQLDQLRQKSLLVETLESTSAAAVLKRAGILFSDIGKGAFVVNETRAVSHPETVANLLVRSGCSLTRLSVEEEDLESYFLRTIGAEGGSQQ